MRRVELSNQHGAECADSAVVYHPDVMALQRIALYETKTRFYLVGSNNTQTSFRILKIDRMENKTLEIADDKTIYSSREIRELLNMIDVGNRSKVGQKVGSGLTRTVSAFGIAGFVRFLEGYYIILITKRRKVAIIGHHTIFKIEDTAMIYIPCDTKEQHQDEQRYLKMFQSIDLSSNFYFSYSYDLTHTLQHNLSNPKFLQVPESDDDVELSNISSFDSGQYSYRSVFQSKFLWNEHLLANVQGIDREWFLPIIHGFVDQSNISIYGKPVYVTLIARRSKRYAGTRFLKRGANLDGDVANEVESEQIACDASIGSDKVGHYTSFVQMRGSVPAQWAQDISKIQPKPPIFIEIQDPFAVVAGKHFNDLMGRFGSPIVVINLVKKRERKRHEMLLSEEFKKQIDYLNQFILEPFKIQYIPFDMARCNKAKNANVMARLSEISYRAVKQTGIFHSRRTSFLQKVPVWGNKHYIDLLNNAEEKGVNGANVSYQTGIVRTNCVDCLDRTNTAQFAVGKCALAFQLYALGVIEQPRLEFDTDCVRMLEEMYEDQGDTLALQYGGSALVHRIKTYRKLAPWTSKGNDIMQTMRRYYSNTLSDTEKQNTMNVFLGVFVPQPGKPPIWEKDYNFDTYLHRSSVIPKEITNSSKNDDQKENSSGNSQETPEIIISGSDKETPVKSGGKSMEMSSSDGGIKEAAKSDGKSKEAADSGNVDDAKAATESDDSEKLDEASDDDDIGNNWPSPLTQWWDLDLLKYLPFPRSLKEKTCSQLVKVSSSTEASEDYYRAYELTVLQDLFAFSEINHSVRDFMPNFTTDFSPFTVRIRVGKKREEMSSSKTNLSAKNPSVAGNSTSSTNSTEEDSDHSDSDTSELELHSGSNPSAKNQTTKDKGYVSFEDFFPGTRTVYGIELSSPSSSDLQLYRRWTSISRESGLMPSKKVSSTTLPHPLAKPIDKATVCSIPLHDYNTCLLKPVAESGLEIYKAHIQVGLSGSCDPSQPSLDIYRNYVNLLENKEI